MTNIKFKRCLAYLIDLFIISMLVSLLGEINFLNPSKDKYHEVAKEYSEYYESNFGNTTTINTSDVLNEEYAGYIYDLNRYALSNTLTELAVIILYFTLFPRFNNNQTIGKRLLKIKVVSTQDEKVPIWKHFVRSIILPICANVIAYNCITILLNMGALFMFKGVNYLNANLIITYIVNIFCYVDIICMFVRKDNRSLKDIICKTRVVEIC